MPLRNPVILAKELATLQFLSDNRVDPRRRRRLERRRVRGGRRPQVGARQADRRDARHHDAAARGRDGSRTTASSTRSTTCSSSRGRRSGRCSGSAAGRSWPTRSRPTCPKFVESVKARTVRADGWIPRPTCPPPDIARDWAELQAAMREAGRDPADCLVAHENFLAPRPDQRPGQGARGAAPGVPQGDEQRARAGRTSSRSTCSGRPDEIIASLQARVDAGVEYFFLHTMTPDPAQLQYWVDEIIPNVTFPSTAGPVRRPPTPWPGGAPPRRWGDRRDPARRAARQAAPAAPLAGHARRRVRRGRHRRALRPAGARARRRGSRRRGGAWSRLARARRDRAVQAGRGRAVRRGRGRRGGDRRGQQRRQDAPRAGSSGSTPTRPGSGPASSWRWAVRSPAPRSSSRAPAARRTRWCTPASRPVPPGSPSATGPPRRPR